SLTRASDWRYSQRATTTCATCCSLCSCSASNGVEMPKWASSWPLRRVSSAHTASTTRNTCWARGERSPRLPMGVATTCRVGAAMRIRECGREGRILSPFTDRPGPRMDMYRYARPAQPVSRLRWLVPCLGLLLAAGCASVATAPSAAPEHSAALAQLDQGQAQDAAQRLEALAASARGAQRNALLADAAFAWHEAGEAAQARRVSAQLDPRRVSGA